MNLLDGIKARYRSGIETVFAPRTPAAAAAPSAAKAEGFPGAAGGYSGYGGVRYINISGVGRLGDNTGLPGSNLNWATMAGDPWRNSAVAVAISWARRNFPQASPVVRHLHKDDIIDGHPLTTLLYRPNPYYSGRTLWAGTLLSWIADGNAYWLKVRDGAGRIVELWYLPHFQITPRFVDGRLIYEHWDGRKRIPYEARDIVHFRNGIDPDNALRGMSDLKALLREVATDNECTVYDASILRNMGIPGVIISPGTGTTIDERGADTIKQRFEEKFTGDNRGRPLIVPGPIEVHAPGFSPEEMALDRIRRVPEARITGAIGIPAMVLGLAVGENQRTYANMSEAREAAAEEFLIPTYTSIADDVDMQLVGVYDVDKRAFVPEMGDPTAERFDFDTTKLRMLADDVNATATRSVSLYTGGLATRGEMREAVGLEDRGEEDDVFAALPHGIDDPNAPEPAPAPVAPVAAPAASLNGTGAVTANQNGKNGAASAIQ